MSKVDSFVVRLHDKIHHASIRFCPVFDHRNEITVTSECRIRHDECNPLLGEHTSFDEGVIITRQFHKKGISFVS